MKLRSTEKVTSKSGYTFIVRPGEHRERFPDDACWTDVWPITHDGRPAGKLFRSLSYGKSAAGEPRWSATIRDLYWRQGNELPHGLGFDVAAFDTAEEALAAWCRSADEILNYAAGKPVKSIYSKTGTYQKEKQP